MPTGCNCANATCSCLIVGSGSVHVEGSGSETKPIVITVDQTQTEFVDSSTVVWSPVTGDGTEASPFQVIAQAIAAQANISFVDSASIDFTVTGGGTAASPFVVTAVVKNVTTDDTGWITGGAGSSVFVADATNFTLTASFVRRIAKQVFVNIQGTSKITINAGATTGDIGNTVLGKMAAAYIPSGAPSWQALSSGGIGRLGSYIVDSTGTVSFCATTPNVNINVGDSLSFSGSYLLT